MAKSPGPTPRELAERAWVQVADLLDLQLSPLGLAAMERLGPLSGQVILDVGCGAGQTLRQLALRVGPTGGVIGVDISPALLDLARSRTDAVTRIQLIEADASSLDLPDESVDGVYSRLGVMALDEPVSAFANFRRMMRRGGRLSFVCWRALDENELDLVPLQAAGLESHLDPTPFRFARRDHLEDVLRSAGFRAVRIEPFDREVSSGGIEAMLCVLTKVGPLGRILREAPELMCEAEPRVRAALLRRADASGEVRLRAATWLVSAVAT